MAAVEVQTLTVRRLSIRTADAEETYAYVRASIGDHRWKFRIVGNAPSAVGQHAQVDGIGVTALALTDISYQALRPPHDDLVFWSHTMGQADYGQHGESFRPTPGTVGLFRPNGPLRSNTSGVSVRSISLAPQMVARVAVELGIDDGPVVFHSGHPINAELADHFRQSMLFVGDRVLTAGRDRMPELIVAQLTRFAAHAALATFPNTTTAAHLRGPGRYLPSAIRRAIAYIDEHAAEPLTLADIARAAGLHPRTLEAGFARLDSTPMTYLRRVRLQRAHEDLTRSDPSSGATVGAIAARWGFGHPGRFSALYRRTYGRPPSEVLRD